ncbi:MAG: hypothetical protein E7329_11895 [Clostridiales bacterium]|nr:hypothetical protein [Clostridiales bacterium]
MKRAFSLLLLFIFLFPLCAGAEKVKELPSCFTVSYKVSERMEKNDKAFISKDVITTAQKNVDQEINALADAFDAQLSPSLQPLSSPRRNSRLDIHIVHSVSGQSAMSFLVLARESYRRVQKQSPFECRTFDMETGEKITLTDLFDENSEAWDLMAVAVYEALSHYFPLLEADEEKLSALCTKEALQQANFMLGPVCLSLHYEARLLYPDQPTIMRVSIPYRAFQGMMTDYGREQTDNSMYQMVALTFDDGPTYTTTASLLNQLRYAGAQVTFFLVGDRIAEYEDIVMRQNDENHSIQSHHFKHTDSTKSTPARIQTYAKRFDETLTSLIGLYPKMMRAPYGLFEPFMEAGIQLPQIQWDVDTKDWTGKSSSAVLSVVKAETKDGSIILMHDIEEKTPESAKLVLEWLRKKGYLCVTMEDLLIQNGHDIHTKKVYYSVTPLAE